MSLSLLVLVLIPLFVLPAFLFATNRIRIYFYCSLTAALFTGIFFIITTFLPDILSEEVFAQPFMRIFSLILNHYPGLSTQEQAHIVTHFLYLIIYLLVYFISYLLFKIFYIGTNPAIHKPIKIVTKIAYGTSFFILTYIPLVFFFVNIRIIFPFEDGFLSNLFDLIYLIEA